MRNWDRAFLNEDYSYGRGKDPVTYDEDEDGYEYHVALPGVKKKDVRANVVDGVITVEAKKDGNTVSKSFSVPDEADVLTTLSKMEDGLLTIKVEKKKEAKPVELKIS